MGTHKLRLAAEMILSAVAVLAGVAAGVAIGRALMPHEVLAVAVGIASGIGVEAVVTYGATLALAPRRDARR